MARAKKNKLIYVASPYRGNVAYNTWYACEACKHVLSKGHVPFAPHLFFTQFLDDSNDKQRRQGIQAGVEIMRRCDELWWFGNEFTNGMQQEMRMAAELNLPIVHEKLDPGKEET